MSALTLTLSYKMTLIALILAMSLDSARALRGESDAVITLSDFSLKLFSNIHASGSVENQMKSFSRSVCSHMQHIREWIRCGWFGQEEG